MNCNIFHKRVLDFIEGNVSKNIREDMEEHRLQCESCNASYYEELEIHKEFKEYFSVKDVDFNSSRADIINSIDSCKYKKNPLFKIRFYVHKYKKQHLAWVAVFVFIFFGATYMYKTSTDSNKDLANTSVSEKSKAAKGITDIYTTPSLEDGKIDEGSIKFNKTQITSRDNVKKIDSWKASINGKYNACIAGNSINEDLDITKLYLKENDSGKLWSFSIVKSEQQYNTPIYLEWMPVEDKLILIIGESNNSKGGSIYLLNINTGVASLVYKPNDLEQVKSLKMKNSEIIAELIVFEDPQLLKSHIDSIKISSKSIKSMTKNLGKLPKEARLIYEYQENINNKRLEAALKLIYQKQIDSKTINYQEYLYGISSMDITSLKLMTSKYTINNNTKMAFEHKAFLAEVDYKLKDGEFTKIKSGKNENIIILVRDSITSNWKISEINPYK